MNTMLKRSSFAQKQRKHFAYPSYTPDGNRWSQAM